MVYFKKNEKHAGLVTHWISKGNMAKNEEDALVFFDRALDIDSRNADALYGKGSTLYKLGKYQEALKYLNYATGNNRDHGEAWYVKGLVVERMNIPFSAIKCYREAVRIEKKNLDAWDCLGEILFRVKKYEEAIQCYDKILMYNSKSIKSYINKGKCLANQQNLKEAIECFNEAIKIDKTYALAYDLKGKIMKLEGKNKSAAECFELRDLYSTLCPQCRRRLLNKPLKCPYCSTKLSKKQTNPNFYLGDYNDFNPPAPITIMCKVFKLPWGVYKYNKGTGSGLDDIRLQQIQKRINDGTYCCESCQYFFVTGACDYKKTKVNPKAMCKHFEPKKYADFMKSKKEIESKDDKETATQIEYQFITERRKQ